MTRRIEPIAATDADGSPIFIVPTRNGPPVRISRKSFAQIGSRRIYWNLSGNGHPYVRCMGRDNNVGVARLIAGVGPGRIVRYRDGDPANLRDDNLEVARGRATRRDRAVLEMRKDDLAASILVARIQSLGDSLANLASRISGLAAQIDRPSFPSSTNGR